MGSNPTLSAKRKPLCVENKTVSFLIKHFKMISLISQIFDPGKTILPTKLLTNNNAHRRKSLIGIRACDIRFRLLRITSCIEGGFALAMADKKTVLHQLFQRIFNGCFADGGTKLHDIVLCELPNFSVCSSSYQFCDG